MGNTTSLATAEQNEWSKVKSIPGAYPIICSNIVKLNEEEFVVMTWNTYFIMHKTYIHKYNIKHNKWTQMTNLNNYKDDKEWNRKIISFDRCTNKLFILEPCYDTLTIINLDTIANSNNNTKSNSIVYNMNANKFNINCTIMHNHY